MVSLGTRPNAEHAVGCVHALLHPGIDVVTRLYLRLIDVRRMTQRAQLLGGPERPIAIALRVADEYIRHARRPA